MKNFFKRHYIIFFLALFFIFPISNSFGAMVTEVDDQEFADGSSTSMSGIHFNDDGTKMFLLYQTHGDDHNYVNQYNLSTPYDISTGTYAGDSARCYLDYGDGTGSGHDRTFDLEFSSDGLKLFTVYGSGGNIAGSEHLGSEYKISKNINDFQIDFKLNNQNALKPNTIDEATINLTSKF